MPPLVLTGYGIKLEVKNGHLIAEWGIVDERKKEEFSRANLAFDHLVIVGKSGNLTLNALDWLTKAGVPVTVVDHNGQVVTSVVPEKPVSAWVKRRQATLSNVEAVSLVRLLLERKLKNQLHTLARLTSEKHKEPWMAQQEIRIQKAVAVIRQRLAALHKATSVDSCRVLEMQAASAYWQAFEGIPLKFTSRKIPPYWRTITQRTSSLSGTPRKATNPFHACLNYLYAVLATNIKMACSRHNLDPELGILHVDKTVRDSLVYDLMEPIRPKADWLLLDWILIKKFTRDSFLETPEGVCLVNSDLVPETISLAEELTAEVNREVAGFAKKLKVEKLEESRVHSEGNSIEERDKTGNESRAEKVKAEISNMATCLTCGQEFISNTPRQKFCSTRCRETYRKRLLREKRKAEGKCPQCGRPMVEGARGTYKERVSYCKDCMEYWKNRYWQKKA